MSLLQSVSDTWKILGQSIYTGERLEANLRALTMAGSLFAIVGLMLAVVDFLTGRIPLVISAFATFVFGAGCAYCAGVLKRRDIAVIFPVLFCAIAFTFYTVTGAGEGSLLLWSFTLPIGISYFVSVKYGFILSIYHIVLFSIVFYTPIGDSIRSLYPEQFVTRFPVLYASTAILTTVAMVQYHRGVLFENDYARRLSEEVDRQTKVATDRANRLEELNDEVVQTLAVAIDAKDRYTNGHSFRVSWYSVALARRLGWDEDEIDELEREALLHDIGKIGVPDAVLNKPGRLTDEEFAIIKSHTTIGGDILSTSRDLSACSQVARYHHERYDGRGYPEGLSGEQIPIHARVVAIADAYDAMRSDRIYRKGLSLDIIHEELAKGSGTQFDPQFLVVFKELSESGALDEIAAREPPSKLD